jgi:uroporphyrinogen-III synthase
MLNSALTGRRVVVTRAPHQAAALCTLLRGYGVQPLEYPCIEVIPPEDITPLDQALLDAVDGAFDLLVLTSANTVQALVKRLNVLGIDVTALQGVRTAAIGPATASAAKKHLGLDVTVVPGEYVAEALAEVLQPEPGTRILLPRAEIARPVLFDRLAEAGAEVTVVTAYRTIAGTGGVDLPALLAAGQVDAVTLTSSSTARYFVQRLLAEEGSLRSMEGVCVACIGPITAATAREMGLDVQVIAESYTLRGLVEALEVYYSDGR